MTRTPPHFCGALCPTLLIKEKHMNGYGYSSPQPRTKAGSHIEDAFGKCMVILMGSSPLLILATGNVAGLLALPMLALIPLAFTKTRRTSQQECKEINASPVSKAKPKNNLSPKDQELADKFLRGMSL